MIDKQPPLPDRDTLVKGCELGCGHTQECFLANIRAELSAAATSAVIDNEMLGDSPESFDDTFTSKAEILRAIESALAKCSLEQAGATLYQNPKTA